MKKSNSSSVLSLFLFIGLIVLGIGFYSGYNYWQEENNLVPNPFSPKQCQVTNCHGMDITCGYNPPDACTEIYMLGDRCRQYVSCGEENGSCVAMKNQRFAQCISCVKICERDNKDDPEKLFLCESSC